MMMMEERRRELATHEAELFQDPIDLEVFLDIDSKLSAPTNCTYCLLSIQL